MRRVLLIIAAAAVATALLAPAAGASRPAGSGPKAAIVFGAEGNNLNAFSSVPPFKRQRVITTIDDDPKGLDINAQICFFPKKKDGSRWFIAGEDTGQPNPPQGWGIFRLRGDTIGKLKAKKIGKLTPTYQGSLDNAENYGCGFLPGGQVLTTDVGNQASGNGDGQLIVWFPPFNRTDVKYCKVDTAIATAGNIQVRGEDVYVPSARPPTSGVWRYTGPWPTSNTPAGGCDSKDSTGAPMTTKVQKSIFIPSGGSIPTPNATARAPHGGFYVSSVISGTIGEFDRDGTFIRNVLEPAAGDTLGAKPYKTGTPLGIGVDRKGDIFYADIGVTVTPDGVGPGDHTGTLRKIRFVDGEPQPPQTMDTNLDFPDGIGVLEAHRR